MGFEADSSKSSFTSVIARPEDWLVGGGEMGKLIRSMDWTKTPLGPIEFWPQSLRTTVSLCLASNFPISLVWGPNHVQIYNDGYWPICGGKHPHSMGQDFTECWAAPWPVIGEAFERAAAGETSYLENQRMFLDRNGYLEETCFTFSFSPIRDETGGVGGLFHPVTETTSRMLSERRTRALRDLAACAGKAQTIEEACTLAAQTLKVGSARALYQRDAVAGDALLAELEIEMQTAVTDIRRLAYDLRPPALDELGLVGAIRKDATRYGTLAADTPGLAIGIEAPDSVTPRCSGCSISFARSL